MELLLINQREIKIERKNIKNINLRLYPPHGDIRVTAPRRLPTAAIEAFVLSKFLWIEKRIEIFKNLPSTPVYEFVSGEKHIIWGQPYTLDLNFPAHALHAEREKIFNQWKINKLKAQIALDMGKWQRAMGLGNIAWSVRKTKTRWGSYSLRTRKISFNSELIKKPRHCLEYVVLHELAHVFVPNHGQKFKKILDQHMPHWRLVQNELRTL